MSFYLPLDIKQQQEYIDKEDKSMSQTHSIEVVLTASDRGFSPALNNALNLLNGFSTL